MFKNTHKESVEDTVWLSAGVHIVELNGATDAELAAGSFERVLTPLGGSGVDVAYTVDGVTSVQFLRSGDEANDVYADVLYLPAGVDAVVRGDASLSVTEAEADSVKQVQLVSGEALAEDSNLFNHIDTDSLHVFDNVVSFTE